VRIDEIKEVEFAPVWGCAFKAHHRGSRPLGSRGRLAALTRADEIAKKYDAYAQDTLFRISVPQPVI
jgi:hypothetical protein